MGIATLFPHCVAALQGLPPPPPPAQSRPEAPLRATELAGGQMEVSTQGQGLPQARLIFCRAAGGLVAYEVDGRPLIEPLGGGGGLQHCFWRAPTDNDNGSPLSFEGVPAWVSRLVQLLPETPLLSHAQRWRTAGLDRLEVWFSV